MRLFPGSRSAERSGERRKAPAAFLGSPGASWVFGSVRGRWDDGRSKIRGPDVPDRVENGKNSATLQGVSWLEVPDRSGLGLQLGWLRTEGAGGDLSPDAHGPSYGGVGPSYGWVWGLKPLGFEGPRAVWSVWVV